MVRPILIWLACVALGTRLIQDADGQIEANVHATEVLRLVDSLAPNGSPTDMYERIGKLAFDSASSDRQELVAFEENSLFVYAVGDASRRNPAKDSLGSENPVRLIRRFIFLRPSTFVIEDELQTPGSKRPIRWSLYSHNRPAILGSLAKLVEGEGEFLCETVLPTNATREVRREPSGAGEAEEYRLSVTPQENRDGVRFLHVLYARRRGDDSSVAHSELVTSEGQLRLTINAGQRVFRLTLPSIQVAAGDIAISRLDGKALLERRPLASGILPHGAEGVRLLEQWDADYRHDRPPLWDAGRPSHELRRVVEDGTIRTGRAVELGCGSGTDAIYLASKGFDVTAIDIAPSALRQAQEKARKAGVQVRWLLADVLAPPQLDPFDFIYDRGCYHEVRNQNLAAYLETVRRYSHPGTRFVLLAGSINEMVLDYGPPRLAEQEIRNDFAAFFDFEWFMESRFEIASPGAMGPLAWVVLMRRKATP
jgi:methyl halide transferase